jgi:hypothetical protein
VDRIFHVHHTELDAMALVEALDNDQVFLDQLLDSPLFTYDEDDSKKS